MPEDRLIYRRAKYIDTKEAEKPEYNPLTEEDRPIINVERVIEEPLEILTQIKRVAHPKMNEWKKPQSLNRNAPEVFGTLFDRLRFLQSRADELESMIEERAGIHKDVVAEITKDIEDKERAVVRIADIEEKRNFKLDISILRRDRRFELLQFWRDVMELRTELREIMEQVETESKIVDIFKGTEKENE